MAATTPTPCSTPNQEISILPKALIEEELELVISEINASGWNDQQMAHLRQKSNKRDEFYFLLLSQAIEKNQVQVFEKYLPSTTGHLCLLGIDIVTRLLANPNNWDHQKMLFILRPTDERLSFILTNRIQTGDSSFLEKFKVAYPKLWSTMEVIFPSQQRIKSSHKMVGAKV